MHVSCTKCGIEDLLEFKKNYDEVFLEFLSKFDEGLVSENGISENLKDEGIVRAESEIKKMIGNNKPDIITETILYSKKDYISQYKVLKNPEPEMGSPVEEMGLDDKITAYLKEIHIEVFYKFQEKAIEEIIFGENVVIEAPTASGKTEAFLIPVIQKIKNSPNGQGVFAVFVYPTKALARDQHPKIQRFAEKSGINVRVFDGDTSQTERREIIDKPPQILVTNFDVIHYHLWHQTKFASILKNLRILVVDETHVYSGIFGSNVHYIIKRLKRICTNKVQFVAASATLDDAKEFCEKLFGTKMKLIHGSGKKGQTDFVMLFPSLRNQRALMVDLTKKLTEKNHKTMVFNNSHLNSELLAMQAKNKRSTLKFTEQG